VQQTSRTIKDYIFLFLKGFGMGSADVVPGVSGGTIAFIAGIYEELISSINNINQGAFKVLRKRGASPLLETRKR
jgi:putative membrane protein